MNFTPFLSHFASSTVDTLPINTNSNGTKFSTVPNGNAVAGGQVVAVLNSNDNGITYLHPIDIHGYSVNLGNSLNTNQHHNQVITLPVSIPAAKPGDQSQQQTLQIQVLNANSVMNTSDKIIPVSLQHFGQVVHVAYNQPINDSNTNISQESMCQNSLMNYQHNDNDSSMQDTDNSLNDDSNQLFPDIKPSFGDMTNTSESEDREKMCIPSPLTVVVPPEVILRTALGDHVISNGGNMDDDFPGTKEKSFNREGMSLQTMPINSSMAEYFSSVPDSLPLSLHHFLKFSDTIKRESNSVLTNQDGEIIDNQASHELDQLKPKRKKKYKKKPPKPKRPRPGQVHIVTALDGTLLFCCPECNMAYPEKFMLEQHLIAHKIERRFICDICGAGLKRKEHLERHKLGHNPERPYVCTICNKGFKRKEHLNLHTVIHSGEKNEICMECGKGFYRRDHLRKHTKSHIAKRIREQMQQQQQLQRQFNEQQHQHQHAQCQTGQPSHHRRQTVLMTTSTSSSSSSVHSTINKNNLQHNSNNHNHSSNSNSNSSNNNNNNNSNSSNNNDNEDNNDDSDGASLSNRIIRAGVNNNNNNLMEKDGGDASLMSYDERLQSALEPTTIITPITDGSECVVTKIEPVDETLITEFKQEECG